MSSNYFSALILFPIIILIIDLGEIHGRSLHQRPILGQMTQDGQVFECVDFYKQPAFDHPLLKNQVPEIIQNSTTSILGKFNSRNGSCPVGTVPISNYLGEEKLRHHRRPRARVHCYAVVKTNTNRKFYGSSAQMSMYKPSAQGDQWSSSRIKLSSGPDSIDAGWMVYPNFFKDNEAHLYARFNAGPTECLNFNCPGFVQVANDLPLGSIPQAYSSVWGRQLVMGISIDKHTDDGNWWLSMTWNNSKRQIGYWPSSLFTGLRDAAAKVEWGGEINDPAAAEPAPSMGSGYKADYDQSYSSFFQHVTIVDENHNNVMPDGTDKFYDCPELYTALDWGNQGQDYGRIIFYGGSQSD